MKEEKQAVLVFDTHRGIMFGRLESHNHETRTVKLTEARHCFSFSAPDGDEKGVMSLATIGPQDGSRVGPPVTVTIHDVSKVVECTPVAVERWECAKW